MSTQTLILTDVRTYLMANGITTPIYLSKMPDEPDTLICLYEYAGVGPEMAHDGQAWENPRLQAVVRNENYAQARGVAQDVYEKLNGKANFLMTSPYLKAIALQSPFPMMIDARKAVDELM